MSYHRRPNQDLGFVLGGISTEIDPRSPAGPVDQAQAAPQPASGATKLTRNSQALSFSSPLTLATTLPSASIPTV